MEIRKIPNEEDYYDIELIKDNKTLKMFFAGNLDLYISLENGKLIPQDQNVTLTLDIDKEDNEIYYLFKKLYENIINANTSNGIWQTFTYRKLVNENKNINWISDDGIEDAEDIMKISMVNEKINLSFVRRKKIIENKMKNPLGITVRIRNARSRYKPFNLLFMDLYNNLQKIEIDKKYVKKL